MALGIGHVRRCVHLCCADPNETIVGLLVLPLCNAALESMLVKLCMFCHAT
jgi:hypothetical protein